MKPIEKSHPFKKDLKTFGAVYFALLMLVALTAGAAYLPLGSFGLPVALLIAFSKSVLIVLFFMHVRASTALTRTVILSALLWLGILLVLTASDYVTRAWDYNWSGPVIAGQPPR